MIGGMAKTPAHLDEAYALKTPEDNRRLYAGWAETYDEEFARQTGYRLPEAVAAAYASIGGGGPVLDVGAGTGLVAERLAARGIGPVDGTDISPEMLARAEAKGVYRRLIAGDVTVGLDLPGDRYAGIVSAGTFTLGHLGPGALSGLFALARPGARVALSVNAAHYEAESFGAALARLPLADLALSEVPIYAENGVHGADRAFIVTFSVG